MGASGELRPSLRRLMIDRASGSIGEGKYRVFASLGRGGMADVLLGVAHGPKGFSKLVVVKRLRSILAEDPAMVNMFLDEARLAARLNHPNVIHTYEIGEEQGTYFIVMEYLEGRPLHEILDALKETGQRLPMVVWAKIFADALAGLHHAHELTDYDGTPLHVVHRDVSPQNILVTFDGRVKVVDFGVAKAELNITRTETGVIKGKLAYMAPEQLHPKESLDRRADLFAMGIVMWECLTTRRLITGSASEASTKIVDMEFPAPSTLEPKVPRELDAITMKALERDPTKRYQTAGEMRDALEGYLRAEGHFVREEEIGRPVAELFAAQREDVKEQIRIHMANLGSGRALPPAEPDEDTYGGPSSQQQPKVHELPLISIRDSGRSVRAVHSNASKPSGGAPLGVRWLAVAAAVGAVGGGVWLLRPRALPPAPRPESSHATASPPPPPTVHLSLRASPDGARITLDGAPVQNPFDASFARDTIEHLVQVASEGYAPETRLVRFDVDDVALDVTLHKAEPPPPASGVRPAPPSHPAAPRPSASDRPKLDKDPFQ